MMRFIALLLLLWPSTLAESQPEGTPQGRRTHTIEDVDQFIVTWVDSMGVEESEDRHQKRVKNSLKRGLFSFDYVHRGSHGTTIVRVTNRGKRGTSEILQHLLDQWTIKNAEPNLITDLFLEPNDVSYNSQWAFRGVASSNFGITHGMNLPGAWDITTGSPSVVVAVLDTGITSHPDLDAKVLPGYDMISNNDTSSDGDGKRDSDPADPGDFVIDGNGIVIYNSTWHGTYCAGIVAAVSNNGVGVAGVSWGAKILPIRIQGQILGLLADLADGIRWAAGLKVDGAPINPNQARVISISIGSTGSDCLDYVQRAIDAAVNAGCVIIVAAGNSNIDAKSVVPCNCNNVICVAAHGLSGLKAKYSNYGVNVDILAPGGDGDIGVLSTHNSGTTVPGAPSYEWRQGSSAASAHVAGLAALILSVNPSLRHARVENILKSTASPFVSPECNAMICGAGLANATAAISHARDTAVETWTPTPTATPPVASYECPAGVPTRIGLDSSAQLSAPYFDLGATGCSIVLISPQHIGAGYLKLAPNGSIRRTGLSFTATNVGVWMKIADTSSPSISAKFTLMFTQTDGFCQIRFVGSTIKLCQAVDASGAAVCGEVGPLIANVWYYFQLRLDYARGTTSLFINGNRNYTTPWQPAAWPISRIVGYTLSNVAPTAYAYYDELQVECAYVAIPIFAPYGGPVADGTSISITSATSGTVLCYTSDGTIPACSATKTTCTSGTLYTTSFTKTTAMNGLTFKAIACKYLYGDSTMAVMIVRSAV